MRTVQMAINQEEVAIPTSGAVDLLVFVCEPVLCNTERLVLVDCNKLRNIEIINTSSKCRLGISARAIDLTNSGLQTTNLCKAH